MGWNESSNNDKNKWNGKPPDLEAALQAFLDKLKKAFGIKTPAPTNAPKSPDLQPSKRLLILFCSGILLLWILAGIFIVDPAEQAVVLRFGRYVKTVGPGPHWIPRLICSKRVYNVDRVSDYSYAAQMLTKDENLVSVSLAVQYRIGDLKAYLFNVTDPEESLQQATSSALRQVVGVTTLDQIITEGREAWGADVHETLVNTLKRYHTGIEIVNVAPQPARAPENVQDAFDDAIKAQEDEKRFKEQAFAYQASVVPIAQGNTKRIIQEAEAFAKQAVLRAKGETAEFLALLPEYTRSPTVTAERMYLDTLQQVFTQSSKIIVDGKSGNFLSLPLKQLGALQAASEPVPLIAKPAQDTVASNNNQLDEFIRPTTRDTTRPTERN